jgi:hypothetical protein
MNWKILSLAVLGLSFTACEDKDKTKIVKEEHLDSGGVEKTTTVKEEPSDSNKIKTSDTASTMDNNKVVETVPSDTAKSDVVTTEKK